jgi:uncharacterized RDD family membrane protein YckC
MASCRNHPEVTSGLVGCAVCRGPFCRNCLVTLGGAPYCATCKDTQVRDLKAGVASGLDLASIGRRFLAQFIDNAILQVASFPLGAAIGFFLGVAGPGSPDTLVAAQGISFVASMALWFSYDALMVAWRGQTVGKMALKIKVVTPSGGDVTMGQAWVRAVSRIILIVDPLVALFTKEKTCLHDIFAKTRVVDWRT